VGPDTPALPRRCRGSGADACSSTLGGGRRHTRLCSRMDSRGNRSGRPCELEQEEWDMRFRTHGVIRRSALAGAAGMGAIAVMLSLGTAVGLAADYFDNNNNVCEGPQHRQMAFRRALSWLVPRLVAGRRSATCTPTRTRPSPHRHGARRGDRQHHGSDLALLHPHERLSERLLKHRGHGCRSGRGQHRGQDHGVGRERQQQDVAGQVPLLDDLPT
jgi:hypothetical protein